MDTMQNISANSSGNKRGESRAAHLFEELFIGGDVNLRLLVCLHTQVLLSVWW
jgi:hypothetical protein